MRRSETRATRSGVARPRAGVLSYRYNNREKGHKMNTQDYDREDMVRVGGVWVCERDIPDAAELAEWNAHNAAERKAAELRPGDRTPDECPW